MTLNAFILAGSLAIACTFVPCARADDTAESEPDDRLPRDAARLLDELVERGMPELVERLLQKRPAMHRVHAARAAVNAGLGASGAAERERFFDLASRYYRDVLRLGEDETWLIGVRRRFRLAEWHVEFGDLILRQRAAPDLDRFEITSGLDFDRKGLQTELREAHESFRRASALLARLVDGMQSDDEIYLLLGIAGRIPRLARQCGLNGAWTSLYLGTLGEPDDADRDDLLESSLHNLDGLARSEREPARKYNALLGAGLALRELGRLDEAGAAFKRVRDSTAPLTVTARARYEMARVLIRQGRFEGARAWLAKLAAIPERRLTGEDSGAAFYVRLAPLIAAYSFMRQADAADGPARKDARESALRAFGSIADRGSYWSDIVAIYLDAMAGGRRDLADRNAAELRFEARRAMDGKRYGEAIRVLRALLDQEGEGSIESRDEARFNLAVCFFQSGDVRLAALAFLSEAHSTTSPQARQAAEYAFRCWRRLAAESKGVDDSRRLSEAAAVLAERFADHPLASEAVWLAAVALENAGDYEAAKSAYDSVPTASAGYWSARRNGIRCLNRFNSAAAESAAGDSPDALRAQAGAWGRLATDLEAAGDAALPKEMDRQTWIDDARLNAAALLASPVVGDFKQSLKVLESLPDSAGVLSLRIRCYRHSGDLKRANAVLGDFLEKAPGSEAGGVLMDLASAMEDEVERLRSRGLRSEAENMAVEMVELMRRLLDWVASQPDRRRHAQVAKFGLAKALVAAGRDDEAVELLDRLLQEAPRNGNYLHLAARLHERLSAGTSSESTASSADRAESLWARLLSDAKLRDAWPDVYWEARFRWLSHQLRRKRAAEVVRGIESERAWFP
ncbi:MAG: tetratricopeptide repeat protein, partial [Planctomycetota bacterium]|nr:tetratricopeptide repeat protein [Planctomycetota bacterium]